MAIIQGADGETNLAVEAATKAARVTIVPRGVGFSISEMTGVMAAALAANSSVFAMRLNPAADVAAYIDRVRLQYTTLTAFTTPVTAGRRLGIYRGAGSVPASGGTDVTDATPKLSSGAASQFKQTNSGDMRIATTAALVTTGITFESRPFAQLSLSHVGAAGGYVETLFDFESDLHEIVLEPGQVLAIRNPVLMDAAGTFQLAVTVHWREAALLSASDG